MTKTTYVMRDRQLVEKPDERDELVFKPMPLGLDFDRGHLEFLRHLQDQIVLPCSGGPKS